MTRRSLNGPTRTPRTTDAVLHRSASRGRPAKKVFINVLVRESTRSGLARLKVAGDLDSQGEVIDRLVADVMARKPERSR